MFTRLRDGQFIFVVLRGDLQLSEAKLKACLGDVRLATPPEISASGAVSGYASPLGLQGAFVVVDELLARSPNLVAGANEFGFHLKNTNFPRDYHADLLADLSLAAPADECPACASPLQSRAASAVCSADHLLFDKLLLALAELHHDEKGLALPSAASPFEIYLMHVPGKTLDTAAAAEMIYAQLSAAGLSVLFDDRHERAGVKFNDADLIGCPVRLTVGERGLQNDLLEIKRRRDPENLSIPLASLLSALREG
jgi:prolyl-tRNA synthetase